MLLEIVERSEFLEPLVYVRYASVTVVLLIDSNHMLRAQS